MRVGSIAPTGALTTRLIRPWPTVLNRSGRFLAVGTIFRHTLPWFGHSREVNLWRLRNLRHIYRWRAFWRLLVASAMGVQSQFGALWITKIDRFGNQTPFGLASLRVVTTVGAGYLVDSLQNLVEPDNMRFHGYGTGGTAEAVGDTALVTELTTQYAIDNTRPTGSQTEASQTVFRTVATLDPDADVAITEHGIFSAASAGVLLDRSLFAVINVTGA